jgi:hypothetical protein
MAVNGDSGVGQYSLATGGYAKFLFPPSTNTGEVLAVFRYDQRIGFAAGTSRLLFEDKTTVLSRSGAGQLTTSREDLGSLSRKVIDELTIAVDGPLAGSSQSVVVEIDVDDNVGWRTIGTLRTDRSLTGTFPVNLECVQWRLRVTQSTASPSVASVTLKLHALGEVDEVVQVPVSLADTGTTTAGRPVTGNSSPMQRFRFLRQLVGSRVVFQDVDFDDTGVSEVYELVGCQYSAFGLSQRSTRTEGNAMAVLTLRRPK